MDNSEKLSKIRDDLIKLEALLNAVADSLCREDQDNRPDPQALTDVALGITKALLETVNSIKS